MSTLSHADRGHPYEEKFKDGGWQLSGEIPVSAGRRLDENGAKHRQDDRIRAAGASEVSSSEPIKDERLRPAIVKIVSGAERGISTT